MNLEKIINKTKKVTKKVAVAGLGILMFYQAAKADFLNGCRPPDKYSMQMDARYNGNVVNILKYFDKKWFVYFGSNFGKDANPFLGAGYFWKSKDGKLQMIPAVGYDNTSKKVSLTNYMTLFLAGGRINIEGVASCIPDLKKPKFSGSIGAGVELFKELRLGPIVSSDGKVAFKVWYNPPSVKYILGLKITQDEVTANARIHF